MKFDYGYSDYLKLGDLTKPVDMDNIVFGDAKILHDQGEFDKAQKIDEELKERLSRWHNDYQECYMFDLYYTYELIIITTDSLYEWTEFLHKDFCNTFQVKLYQFEKTITYKKKEEAHSELYLTYIPYNEALKEYYIKYAEITML